MSEAGINGTRYGAAKVAPPAPSWGRRHAQALIVGGVLVSACALAYAFSPGGADPVKTISLSSLDVAPCDQCNCGSKGAHGYGNYFSATYCALGCDPKCVNEGNTDCKLGFSKQKIPENMGGNHCGDKKFCLPVLPCMVESAGDKTCEAYSCNVCDADKYYNYNGACLPKHKCVCKNGQAAGVDECPPGGGEMCIRCDNPAAKVTPDGKREAWAEIR